jgi:hypothetical protein
MVDGAKKNELQLLMNQLKSKKQTSFHAFESAFHTACILLVRKEEAALYH